jgi:hypothetical protein
MNIEPIVFFSEDFDRPGCQYLALRLRYGKGLTTADVNSANAGNKLRTNETIPEQPVGSYEMEIPPLTSDAGKPPHPFDDQMTLPLSIWT